MNGVLSVAAAGLTAEMCPQIFAVQQGQCPADPSPSLLPKPNRESCLLASVAADLADQLQCHTRLQTLGFEYTCRHRLALHGSTRMTPHHILEKQTTLIYTYGASNQYTVYIGAYIDKPVAKVLKPDCFIA